jgi:hypothetical protein
VAAWVVRRSSNTYAPYGKHRDVVMSADALDELDSLPPEERERRYLHHQHLVEAYLAQRATTKKRNVVAEAEKQENYRIIRESRKAASLKKLLARHWADLQGEQGSVSANEWKTLIERSDALAPVRRLEVVIGWPQIPLRFFPKHWADCSADTLRVLSRRDRLALLERVAEQTGGAWHGLAKRLAGLGSSP